MLLTFQHAQADEKHPDRLILKFTKLSFRKRMELKNRTQKAQPASLIDKFVGNGKKNDDNGLKVIKKISADEQLFFNVPSGTGKAYAFWLPSLLNSGLTIILSPLRSTMLYRELYLKDNFGIHYSTFINADIKTEEKNVLCANVKSRRIRFLYLEPENLTIKDFKEKLFEIIDARSVNLLVIDEAHCISEWMMDFTPSYLHIPQFIQDLKKRGGDFPIIALSMASSKLAANDIVNGLNLSEVNTGEEQRYYRPNFSYQTELVEDFRAKHAHYPKIFHETIPRIVGIQPPQEDRYRDNNAVGLLYCHQTDLKGRYIIKDVVAHYLVETNHVLGAGGEEAPGLSASIPEKAGNSSKPGKSDMFPWRYPFYIRINQGEVADYYRDKDSQELLPQVLITTRKKGTAIKKDNIRFIVHTCMSEGIEEWFRETSRADNTDERVHCVSIVDLPNEQCEKDMLENNTMVPSCLTRCEFGKPSLCDYGKAHCLIMQQCPDIMEELGSVLCMIDTLMSTRMSSGGSRCIDASADRFPNPDLILHRLKQIGLIDGFSKMTEKGQLRYEIIGFRKDINELEITENILSFLQSSDISSSQKYRYFTGEDLTGPNGEIERLRQRCNDAIMDVVREKNLMHYQNHRHLFKCAENYLLVLLSHIYGNIKEMRYRKLWNLKQFLAADSCRTAHLLMHFATCDEHWKCDACDNCIPDLNIRTRTRLDVPYAEDTTDLEQLYADWIENDHIRFDLKTAHQYCEAFKNYATNIYHRCCHILETYPSNIKALYLMCMFAPEAMKVKHAADLIKAANITLSMSQTMTFYDMFAQSSELKCFRFNALDTEYGAMNCRQGENWLFNEARKLSDSKAADRQFDQLRTEMLGARVVMNRLGDILTKKSKVNKMLKEL